MGTSDTGHRDKHGNTHADGGDDEITHSLLPEAYPQLYGTDGNKPSADIDGRTYWSDDQHVLWLDTGSSWQKMAVADHADLNGISEDAHHTAFTPTDHDDRDHSAISDTVRLDEWEPPTNAIDMNDQDLNNVSNVETIDTKIITFSDVSTADSPLDMNDYGIQDVASIGGGGDSVLFNDILDLNSNDLNDGTTTIWNTSNSYIPQSRLENDSITVASNSVSLGSSTSIDHSDLSNIGTNDHIDNLTDIPTRDHNDLNNISSGDHHTKYTDEEAQDAVGNIMTGSGATTVDYDDSADTITISSTDTDTQLSKEEVQDYAWDILSGTQTLIDVTYQDSSDEVDFVVDDDLDQYDNSNSNFISDITSEPIADLSDVSASNTTDTVFAYDGSNWQDYQLTTSGSANITWDNSSHEIDIYADTDTDTTYSAGDGLSLSSQTFSVAPSEVRLDEWAEPTNALDINDQNLDDVASIDGGGDAVLFDDILDLNSNDLEDDTVTIWDTSNQYIPQGRLENDTVTVANNSVSLGGSTDVQFTDLSDTTSTLEDNKGLITESGTVEQMDIEVINSEVINPMETPAIEPLDMNSYDIVDDSTVIWDTSNQYIPQGRLENDSLSVAGNSVSLGGSTSIAHDDLSDAPVNAHIDNLTDIPTRDHNDLNSISHDDHHDAGGGLSWDSNDNISLNQHDNTFHSTTYVTESYVDERLNVSPYTDDETEIEVTGSAYEIIKTSTIVKHNGVGFNPTKAIFILEGKVLADGDTLSVGINIDDSEEFTKDFTLQEYELKTETVDISGWSDGVHHMDVKATMDAGTGYQRIIEVYLQ